MGLQSLQVRRAAGVLMVVAAEAAAVVDPEGAEVVAVCWIWPSSTAPSPPRNEPGTWVVIQWCRDNSNSAYMLWAKVRLGTGNVKRLSSTKAEPAIKS